jgi:hypothetical protein
VLAYNVSGLPARRPLGAVLQRSEPQRTEPATFLLCVRARPDVDSGHGGSPTILPHRRPQAVTWGQGRGGFLLQ